MNTNIGHQHPKVVAAIQEQAAKICTIAPQHVNDARSEAARLIAELAPGDLDHIFFTNGGADAVEHAIRMARLHTGRKKVFAAYRSYHGGTHAGRERHRGPAPVPERLRRLRRRALPARLPVPLLLRLHHGGGGDRAGAARTWRT